MSLFCKRGLETWRHHNKTAICRRWNSPRTSPLCVSDQAAHTTAESFSYWTSPTKTWVNLQLVNQGLYHSVVKASGTECVACPVNINPKIIPHIMGNKYYTIQLCVCTDVTGHVILLGMWVVKWDAAVMRSIYTVWPSWSATLCSILDKVALAARVQHRTSRDFERQSQII